MSHFGRTGPPDIRDTFSLLVLNISFRTTADDLFPLFERCGKVVDVFIPRDRRTGDSRGFAFVRYKYADEAQKAIDRLDGRNVDGRNIMVQFAKYGPNAVPIHKGRVKEGVEKSRDRSRSRSPRPRHRDRDDRRRSRSRSRSRERHVHDRDRDYRRRSRSRSRSMSSSPDHKSHRRARDDVKRKSRSKSRSRSRSRSRSYHSSSPARRSASPPKSPPPQRSPTPEKHANGKDSPLSRSVSPSPKRASSRSPGSDSKLSVRERGCCLPVECDHLDAVYIFVQEVLNQIMKFQMDLMIVLVGTRCRLAEMLRGVCTHSNNGTRRRRNMANNLYGNGGISYD
ncbi:Serine/arginine-rich splicing factor SC35 [Zea mays]|uniref:Serine/arginine-rich splicing factor SC35 n=1 Tax=Zea mays TaxID=4577 RepID=A0A1D6KHX4_MAIZE|nr:Serine/arginine-rich splicing factor SC35 [Zea mays]